MTKGVGRCASLYVEHPAAYAEAIRRNINANASKTRLKKWLAIDGNQRLYDWLFCINEFDDPSREAPLTRNMFKGDFGSFLLELRERLMEWGQLSGKQTDVISNALARAENRLATAETRKAARAANSSYIGSKGERRIFSGRVIFTSEFGTQFGHSNIVKIALDDDEGVVIYFGAADAFFGIEKGARVSMVATIKCHDVYEGEKQTKIARPSKIEIN